MIGSTLGKIRYKMSNNSEVANQSKMIVETGEKKLEMKCETPARPRKLNLKTEHYYDVKLPTYGESQRKYAKLLCGLRNDNEKQE